MKLSTKYITALVLAAIIPLLIIVPAGIYFITNTHNAAMRQGEEAIIDSQELSLQRAAAAYAYSVHQFLKTYQTDITCLKIVAEKNIADKSLVAHSRLANLYPSSITGGLPGYGYIHPEYGAYANWDRKGYAGSVWMCKEIVDKAKRDPAFRSFASDTLHRIMSLTPAFEAFYSQHKDTCDLIWIVIDQGFNAEYPNDFSARMKINPDLNNLNESEEDYVRLFNPENNPNRKGGWLPPYMDAIKRVWMTSYQTPVYNGDQFMGTIGADVLLSTLAGWLRNQKVGDNGYAFMVSGSGAALAMPGSGIDDFAQNQLQKDAFREVLKTGDGQSWDKKSLAAMAMPLTASKNEAIRQAVGRMVRGESGCVTIRLGKADKLLAFSPVEDTKWSVGIVLPIADAKTPIAIAGARTDNATRQTIIVFLLVLLVLLAAILVAGISLGRQMMKPVNEIINDIRRVQDSSDWRGISVEPDNELAALSESINAMVGSILESEKRFRAVFDGVTEAIFIHNPDNGKITDLNINACDMFGGARNDLLNLSIEDISSGKYPFTQEEAVKKIIAAKEGNEQSFRWHAKKLDGSLFWVEAKMRIANLGGQNAVLVSLRDITAQRRAELALQESEEKYRNLISNLPDVIWTTDSDGKTTYISPNVADIFGFTQEEVYEHCEELWFGRIHPEDSRAVIRAFEELFESNVPFDIEYRIKHKSGNWIWLQDRCIGVYKKDGKTYADGMFSDITERKLAEDALRDSERRLNDIINFLPDATFVIDLEGRIIAWNRAIEKMTGFKAEDMLGKGDYEYAIPFFGERHPILIDLALHWKPEYEENYLYVRKSGDTLIAESDVCILSETVLPLFGLARPLYNSQGEIVGAIESIRDMSERKQMMDALQESELRFRTVVENVEAITFVLDKDGVFRMLEGRPLAKFSFGSASMLGCSYKEVSSITPDQAKLIEEALCGNLTRGTSTAYGHVFDVIYSPYRDIDGNLNGVVGIATDITEAKNAENALRDSERRLQDIIDFLPDATFAIDRQGKVIAWNKAIEEMFGVSASDMLGKDNYEYALYIYGERRPLLIDLALNYDPDIEKKYSFLRRVGNTLHAETDITITNITFAGKRNVFLSGKATPLFDSKGEIIGAIESIRDISDYKSAIDEVIRSERLLREVVQNSAAIIFNVDKLGIIRLFEGLPLGKLGIDGAAMVGHSADEVFEDYPGVAESIKMALEGKTERNIFSLGNLILDTVYSPYMDYDGRIDGVVGIASDITERKKAERELEIVNEKLEEIVAARTKQLEHINKELESFSYSISHDLRAPLRAINGYSEIIKEDYRADMPTEAAEYFDRISSASNRMSQLIDDILKLSRVSTVELSREEVDLSRMAEMIVEDLQAVDTGRDVEVVIQPGIVAKATPSLMRGVLENLIGNAWKFTGKTENARIEFGLLKKGKATVYFVRDNGAGFDKKYMHKLFGTFQRLHTEDDFPGTGVGLATVKRIINRHMGEIWAEGELGRGATFYFTIGEG